jgi:ubiquinone/menaquinone biosynthesis C-methylase UbiE
MQRLANASELINATTVLETVGIREGMKVADLGCGATGHYVFPAARMVGPHGVVYAVDIQKSVLDGLRGRMDLLGSGNMQLLWGDIERTRGVGIADGTLDVVLVANNFFVARDRAGLGREVLRLLKSGGTLAVVDWKPSRSPFGPAPESRISPDEAERIMEQVGFRFVRTFAPGEYHYGLIFEKS